MNCTRCGRELISSGAGCAVCDNGEDITQVYLPAKSNIPFEKIQPDDPKFHQTRLYKSPDFSNSVQGAVVKDGKINTELLERAKEPKTLAEMNKDYIIQILRTYENKSEAARVLGITQKTLYNKIYEYGLEHEFIDKHKRV